MLKIEKSSNLKTPFIKKIIDFDKNYYNLNIDNNDIKHKYDAFKNHYILLFDDNKLAGYLLYFNISREKYQKIMESKEILDVIPEDQNEEILKSNKVFLRAIVSKEYQELNWSSVLYQTFKKEIAGREIETIIAYAQHEDSRRFLLTNDFKVFAKIEDSAFLLKKTIRYPLNSTYMMLPCEVTNFSKYVNLKDSNESQTLLQFKRELTKISCYETRSNINDNIDRFAIGKFDFVIVSDFDYAKLDELDEQYEIPEKFSKGQTECLIEISVHRTSGIAITNLIIPTNYLNVTQLQDQLTTKHIYIRVNEKIVSLEKFLHYNYSIELLGNEKTFVTLNKKPENLFFKALLEGENYNSDTSNDRLRVIKEIEPENIYDYDYAETYASNRSIIHIYDMKENYRQNIHRDVSILFICEMVMFRQVSILSVDNKIVDIFNYRKRLSLKVINTLNENYGRSLLFQNRNFNYTTTIKLSNKINKAFETDKLIQEYNENQKFLENLVQSKAAKSSNFNQKILNLLVALFTFIKIIPEIVSVAKFFKSDAISRFDIVMSVVSFILTIFLAVLFAYTVKIVFYYKHLKENPFKPVSKKERQKRQEEIKRQEIEDKEAKI